VSQNLKNFIQIGFFLTVFSGAFFLYQSDIANHFFRKQPEATPDQQFSTTTEQIVDVTEPVVVSTPDTELINDPVDDTGKDESTSSKYRIISPKAGDSFYADSTGITVRLESNDSSELLSAYLVSNKCSNEFCDYEAEFPNGNHLGYFEERAVTFKISLSGSRYIAYPGGEYRIVLTHETEGADPILAMSDPFTIRPSLYKERNIWIGDMMGDFTISRVQGSIEWGVSIYTVGTTTVRGTVIRDSGDNGECFDVIDDDHHKLPTYNNNPDDASWGDFCFFDDPFEELEELLDAKGTTTIQIANYKSIDSPKGGVDSADFVQIVR
jgi:hypothetical protein